MSKKLYNMQLKTNQYGIKGYSDATNQIIDEEIEEITLHAYEVAKALVIEHKDKVQA